MRVRHKHKKRVRKSIRHPLTHSPLTLVSADVESGLYPGITPLDNALRLGFIQKVFGIVAFQLALTAAVATAINASHAAQSLLVANPWIYFLLSMTSILGLIPLFLLKDRHPHNLIALSMWTCTFGVSVGMTVSFYSAVVVAQAVFLTACMVVGLTAYAFHATRKGVEFGWMRPLLLSSLLGLLVSGFLLMFFHSPIAETIYSCRYRPRPADRRFTRSLAHWPTGSPTRSLARSPTVLGATLFSAYIVYDVHLLAAKYDVDEYIWASVSLYLDVLNLFLHILRLTNGERRHN